MYYYIYDSFLNDKKYHGLLAKIENRLTDLGINGKINHLSFLKNIQQVLAEEIKRGVKTVVVVGSDKTLGQIINLIMDLNVVIGYIPIHSECIAGLLNIPQGEYACDVLSARIVKRIDLGKVSNYYFISALETGGQKLTIECDGNYIISLTDKDNIINIGNLNYQRGIFASPNDEYLDLFIENIEKKFLIKGKTTLSHLTFKKIRLSAEKPMPILLMDEKKILKTPVEIKVQPKKLRMIVGRGSL